MANRELCPVQVPRRFINTQNTSVQCVCVKGTGRCVVAAGGAYRTGRACVCKINVGGGDGVPHTAPSQRLLVDSCVNKTAQPTMQQKERMSAPGSVNGEGRWG